MFFRNSVRRDENGGEMKNNCRNKTAGLDLIGDVHGEADKLKELLTKLGYSPDKGVWRHQEERKVVFVGDLIDRGPKARETLRIARSMVDAGTAQMVLGNHEFNLLCLLTPSCKGGFLRPHTERNLKTCRATLDAFLGREAELWGYLEWFRTLPLYLDLQECRVIHAEWDGDLIAGVNGRGYLDNEFLHRASTNGSDEHRTIEILLKGSETPMPHGETATDHDGTERHEVRICWPKPGAGRTYREMAFASGAHIPDVPLPADIADGIKGYGADEPPVFFGHYALKNIPHGLIASNVACLDAGCGKGGPLTAYRWNGERTLQAANFISS
jgi:hypothetical protein